MAGYVPNLNTTPTSAPSALRRCPSTLLPAAEQTALWRIRRWCNSCLLFDAKQEHQQYHPLVDDLPDESAIEACKVEGFLPAPAPAAPAVAADVSASASRKRKRPATSTAAAASASAASSASAAGAAAASSLCQADVPPPESSCSSDSDSNSDSSSSSSSS